MKKFLILILTAFVSAAVNAELVIEIEVGSASAQPIAIVPFANKNASPLPEDVSKIIANNLQRSGDFDTLPTSRMLGLPERFDQVHFRDWRRLGQSYIVVGSVTHQNGSKQVIVDYELVDIFTQKSLISERVKASPTSLRKTAHYISDRVYQQITGVQGVFSTKIAYITVKELTNKQRQYRLNVADADGKGAYTLFTSREPMLSPSWSNDGQHLTYVSYDSGRPAIYIQHVISGNQRKVTSFKGLNDSPMWSPDDSSLVMTLSKDGNAELYSYDLARDRTERLTFDSGIDTEASWSQDGKSVVFTSDRGGSPQVYRMSLRDRIPERLSFVGKYNTRPRYSRDGNSIFYVHKSTEPGDQGFHIAEIDIETGDQRILTSTSLDESPSVSPNGRMIIYSTLRGGSKVLAVVSVDGGAKYFLPSNKGDVLEPAWSPFL
ncbi:MULTISPECIES: Tol-Pal system beta propeller repeat protein TolB [unclassified Oleiphilus]|jgi:TolB protein|uniref:Tol-Pal system beta propeller repeat protein TolB n=2 Tax=Oleiphilus TaxID=141450 RepID=UPI0007C33940|nr:MULTISPECIES: Tol-Pal system beta propeller repeat protein TolB [unclassified Oleiphilus]KZY44041.1 translocation protein TolB [Oleiphilus sp. HI0050]KZY75844.1 translocation protein TolB [Oleiphilus sp. HI0068]KZY80955.1 translocation protein TolB [Oleiphilus sp. HI0069]KZY87034.1 translocation protein TolB [Oleiphilus sp. HI0072]KZZ10852.1 translocation protein TolB [Oleiphilus sp. HI0078]KZZ21946.1 translocation protein TolB [Oleiphilus sp. HI0081]KZZ33543.1 translocation protein TolB 